MSVFVQGGEGGRGVGKDVRVVEIWREMTRKNSARGDGGSVRLAEQVLVYPKDFALHTAVSAAKTQ